MSQYLNPLLIGDNVTYTDEDGRLHVSIRYPKPEDPIDLARLEFTCAGWGCDHKNVTVEDIDQVENYVLGLAALDALDLVDGIEPHDLTEAAQKDYFTLSLEAAKNVHICWLGAHWSALCWAQSYERKGLKVPPGLQRQLEKTSAVMRKIESLAPTIDAIKLAHVQRCFDQN